MFGEPLDRAALAGGVPAFEEQHDAPSGVLDPILQFQQFDLQQTLVHFVDFTGQPGVVGIAFAPGVHRHAVRADQHRIVVVGVQNTESGQRELHFDHVPTIEWGSEPPINDR